MHTTARDHVTQTLRELHWLPVVYHIRYKLCIMMRADVRDESPKYINDILTLNASIQGLRNLRSTDAVANDVPRCGAL